MNALAILNYSILAAFLSMFVLEVGIAMLMLFKDSYSARMRRYLMPIWELAGTTAVFYVVNLIATYPGMLNVIGNAYMAPLLIAALFLLLRNAFLSYSAYSGAELKAYTAIYSLSTIAIAVIALTVLSSAATGSGLGPALGSLDIAAAFLSPFNIVLIIGTVLVALSFAIAAFEMDDLRGVGAGAALFGIALLLFGTYFLLGAVQLSGQSSLARIAAAAALAMAALFCYKRKRVAKYAYAILLFIGILLLEAEQYPYVFGNVDITSYANNSGIAGYELVITAVGGLLLLASVAYLVYSVYLKKEPAPIPSSKA
ncbi:MAG: cytochrome d ubiquinol oxidase subunit II [Candidatus Micrarchaeota archaeon]|nr:cytochrome d ubiquinol oxidase subunit II [Candidatus Micrarchaeota archaeon]